MMTFLASLFFVLAAPVAPQQSGGFGACPNERACDVAGKLETSGTPQSCGVVLSLLGFQIPLGGDDCYPYRYYTPAHQVCHGKRNVGTYCAYEGDIQVLGERCVCVRIAGSDGGTGISQWNCPCTLLPNPGTVTDYMTRNCEITPVPVDPRVTVDGAPKGGGS